MRIAWRTVGRILERLAQRLMRPRQQLTGLCRIGIDGISFRKGQRYLTVVIDHASGRLVWAAEGRDELTLSGFFRLLGPRRCARITHVSADGAWWIKNDRAAEVATHPRSGIREFRRCSPGGIRTRDLSLERAASWSTRRRGRLGLVGGAGFEPATSCV